jgi:hypothetical protein
MNFNRSISICLFLFFIIWSLQAQEVGKSVTNTSSIKMGILGFGYSQEYAIGKICTFNLELGFLTGSAAYKSGTIGNGWDWSLPLAVRVEPRVYYNFVRRSAKGKEVRNNAANFFSLAVSYSSDVALGNLQANPQISIAPHWGFRRLLSTRFYFEPSFGYGIVYVLSPNLSEGWTDQIALNLKVGFLLSK